MFPHLLRRVEGVCSGITLSNHYNTLYGRDAMGVQGLSAYLETDYGYDGYGRMKGLSWAGAAAGYQYMPGSDLVQSTSLTNNGSLALTTSRQWNYGYQLGSIANVANGSVVTSHSYVYDNLNRRTRAVLEDGSMWVYGYNNRNELTGAGRVWADWTAVTGQQFGYGFDNIGNRTVAMSGSAGNLRTTSYTANSLNEYVSISTPGYKDILGVAFATNAVTVNGGLADRKAEYFHREIAVGNGNGPLWQEVTNASGAATVTGGMVAPGGSQGLVYDADGNLTFDGVWNYVWDAENRLIEMTMTNIAGVAPTNRLRLDFGYDYMNRRVSKTVSTNSTGSVFVGQATNYYIYDGWNLVAVFTPSGAIQQAYGWGMDLSGTMTKAGGIGGLIGLAASGTNYFASYDGNGNITGLVNGVDKTTGGRYEYSAFGELLRASGPVAKANPFRFSTKFRDDESGLVYYGCRYYSPSQGRWIGRDTATDNTILNYYLFCHNSPWVRIDPDGKEDMASITVSTGISGFIASRIGGAVFGATSTFYYECAKSDWQDINWNSVATDTAVGGIFGAISGGISWQGMTLADAVLVNASAGAIAGETGGLIVDAASSTGLKYDD
jgi:RHS repeat-associated protein